MEIQTIFVHPHTEGHVPNCQSTENLHDAERYCERKENKNTNKLNHNEHLLVIFFMHKIVQGLGSATANTWNTSNTARYNKRTGSS